MFGLLVGTGLRTGEVATLRLDNGEEPDEPARLPRLRVRGKGNNI
jgi:integrase